MKTFGLGGKKIWVAKNFWWLKRQKIKTMKESKAPVGPDGVGDRYTN